MIPKQFRIHAVLIIACLVMIIFPMISEKPDPEKEQMAMEASAEFLALVDSDQYDKSWSSSAGLMQEKIKREDWVKHLTNARKLTGTLVKRTLDDTAFSTMAHDSPDGEYVVFTYESSYQRLKEATESITVMLDKDGRWKVAGYFVQ